MFLNDLKLSTFVRSAILIPLTGFVFSSFAVEATSFSGSTCMSTPEIQLARSKELKELAQADQADRDQWQDWDKLSEEELTQIFERDLIRRKRVGEIFGEGCLKTADDYLNAALIYQHGETSDHYYQAFIWSKKASESNSYARHLVSLAIDRYLISIGKKQLFGSQYYKKTWEDKCYCMQPVEESFPDSLRKEYSGRSLSESYQQMAEINERDCPKIECDTLLQPTPQRSIIGFW